jgi:phosphatidylinositol dimannoside acyltransferase
VDLVTPGYKAAATFACHMPSGVTERMGPGIAGLWARRKSDRRRMVERHQRRIDPSLDDTALRQRAVEVYRSYGRYWAESFRLPTVTEKELDDRFTPSTYERFEEAMSGEIGAIAVLPHLGSWEWCAYWLARIKGIPVTAVVERLEPPALFEFFRDFRRDMGLHIVPLGPDAGREVAKALKAKHVIALLSDRDVAGSGVPVDFFGEQTTLPAGPATLALRTGAPLLPVAVYDRPGGSHEAVVRPTLSIERQGSLREDVARVTQDIARVLEDQIRQAPEQWHLLQPNWPSDRAPVRL